MILACPNPQCLQMPFQLREIKGFIKDTYECAMVSLGCPSGLATCKEMLCQSNKGKQNAFKFTKVVDHLKTECPKMHVQCPIPNCLEKFQRSSLEEHMT